MCVPAPAVAQWTEHRASTSTVAGSNPASRTHNDRQVDIYVHKRLRGRFLLPDTPIYTGESLVDNSWITQQVLRSEFPNNPGITRM